MNDAKKCDQVPFEDLVDLELNCEDCGTRLYAPVRAAKQVMTTVQSGGIACLICPEGHIQYLQYKNYQKIHD